MKKIKKILIAMMVVLMLAFIASGAKNEPNTARISISLMSQEPDPVEPGGYVDIRFKIENTGWQGTDGVTLELLPEFPFKLQPGKSAMKELGSFRAQQTGVEGVIAKYRLMVDEKAIEGENELELRYQIGDGVWVRLEPFNISVRPFDAILAIEKVELDTEMIGPGKTSNLEVIIKNAADSVLRKVLVKLDLTGIPIAPFGSSNEKTIYQIDSREEKTLNFTLIAEPDAESKLYKIPLKIKYWDELGNNYTNDDNIIGIRIGEKPDLSLTIDSSEIYKQGQVGEIAVKFVNKGVSDIKLVNSRMRESDSYEIISPSEYYVGDIDSDDYETAEFKIYLKEGKDSVKIPVEVEYLSANNIEYNKIYDLDLKLYSDSEAKRLGMAGGGSGLTGFIILIVIVGGGVYLYRKWKKRRKKKHA